MGIKDVRLGISAEDEGLAAGLSEATNALRSFAGDIQSQFAGIGDLLKGVGSAFAGIGVAIAGGAAFGKAVQETVNLTRESYLLGQQLGISAGEASTLKVALGQVGVSQDQFSAAAARITRTLTTNEGAFRSLGVATRDSNGNLRNTADIMVDVNARLLQLKEGTDRNIEATKIYGRGWAELAPVLQITPTLMAAATEKAQALGLVVGQESVDAWQRYRAASADVKDVLDGVMNQVGSALLPVLTSLGNWFGSIGPSLVEATRATMDGFRVTLDSVWQVVTLLWNTVMEGFSAIGAIITSVTGTSITGLQLFENVIRGIEVVVVLLREIFQQVFEDIRYVITRGVDTLMTFASVAEAALTLKWSNVKTAWAAGMAILEDDVKQHMANIAANAKQASDDIENALLKSMATPKETPAARPTEGDSSAGGADKGLMARLEEQLAAKKAAWEQEQVAHGTFVEFSKQMELDYWQSQLAIIGANAPAAAQIKKKAYDLEYQIAQAHYQGELQQLLASEQAAGKNYDLKLQLAREYAAKVLAANGGDTETKAYQEAAAKIIAIEREKQAQIEAIGRTREATQRNLALSEVDQAESNARFLVETKRQSQSQLLTEEIGFENQRYAIKVQALEKDLALEKSGTNDPEKIAQLDGQIEQLEQQHQAKITQIQQQAQLQRDQIFLQGFQTVESAWTKNVTDMIKGTETLRAGIKSIFADLVSAIIEGLVKWTTQQAINYAMQTSLGKAFAMSQIQSSIGMAGAAGTASFAGAPWPVDVGAPAFGASMAGAAAGYASFAAEQGMDVPAGLSPVTKLHPKEMALPAPISEGLRQIIAAGGGITQGARGGDSHTWQVKALDAQSFSRMLGSSPGHSNAVARTVMSHARARGYRV